MLICDDKADTWSALLANLGQLSLKRSNMKSKIVENQRIIPMSQSAAEALAISILAWISQSPDLMDRFLALTGLTAGTIRQAAGEPGFFSGVTTFLMNHEPTLSAFCAECDKKPEEVVACHRFFSGENGDVWL
jgi:hypothetical protein